MTIDHRLAHLVTACNQIGLDAAGAVPATAPLDVDQPVQADGCLVTFWRYYDASGRRPPPPTELARLLRQLHGFDSPPYRPSNRWCRSSTS